MSGHEKHLSLEEKPSQQLFDVTTERVLNMVGREEHHEEKNVKPYQHFQATTEKVLRMVQNAVQKKEASARVVGQNPASNKKSGSSKVGVNVASKERHGMEMLKVKKAEIDPKKKGALEQELIKDYPENGTVEIINWEGTFAPMHGEPYVAPLHHQPDEFWDAIYTSKDPDLPTPPGADVSAETTVHPLSAPKVNMRPLAGMPNPRNLHPDPSPFGFQSNPPNEFQPDPGHTGNNNKIEAKDKDKGKKDKNQKKAPKLTIKEKRKKKKEKKENPRGSKKVAGNPLKSGIEMDEPPIITSAMDHRDFIIHVDDHIHPQPHGVSPNLNVKAQPHVEHVPVHVHAKGKSEENLKTPSEEERESGTTYKPEGAYEYPSFRHPDFNPDTAYDEHGIPIHESPGWTPPPTLPGDNRFGKGRNQVGAGMKNKPNGPLPIPQVAKNGRIGPKRLAVSVSDPKYSVHPEDKLHNNFHGIQDHLALLEHQKALEARHGLHADPLHPLNSQEHLALPLHHLGNLAKDNINHRIKKRKVSSSGSLESISEELDSEELKVASPTFREQETAKEIAYKLSEAELKNKEDSAPIEALNPALYSHRNMLQVHKKPSKPNINIDKIPLDKLPINLDKLAKSSAEVIAVIVSKDGASPKCHIHSKVKLGGLPPLPLSSPEVLEEYNKENKNEGRNPLLYKHRNMLKVSDLKDDGLRLNNDDLIKQLLQKRSDKKQNRKAVTLDDFMKGPQGHTLKGRNRENFNPIFINERKLFHAKTNKLKVDSTENHNIVRREVKEAQNPALYSYMNLFSSNPKQVLPYGKMELGPKPEDEVLSEVKFLHKPIFGGGIPVVDEDSDEKKPHLSSKQYMGKNKEALNPYLLNFPNMFKVNFDSPTANTRGRNKENLDPLTYRSRNSNKEAEALNPHLQRLTNIFGVNYNQLQSIPLEKGKINPLIINKQKAYTDQDQQAVLSKYKNLFASAVRPVNRNGKHQIKTDVNKVSSHGVNLKLSRVRRHIDETQQRLHQEPERLGMVL